MEKIKINDEKVVGYIVLTIGLLIMLYSIFSVTPIFTSGNIPVEFVTANKNTNGTSFTNNSINLNLGEIVEPLFPILNVITWIIIAFFLVTAGGKIAHVGIKMIKIKPAEKKEKTEKKPLTYKTENI